MLNTIWAGLIIIGFVVGALTGNIEKVTAAAIDNAKLAAELALGLMGVMSMWLGIMKIAEKSGLINIISKILKPLMVFLFPDVPENHPAMGAMIMNISANILGMGNAATPFGLKAIEELQNLNRDKSTVTNAMVTFLAINTSSVTLIPATTIGLLSASGAKNPTDIIGPTLIATILSTLAAVIASKTYEKLPKYGVGNNKKRRGLRYWYK